MGIIRQLNFLLLILFSTIFTLPLYVQEDGGQEKNPSGEKRIIDPAIESLKKRVNKALKLYNKGRDIDVNRINLQMGLKNRMGESRKKALIEEWVELEMNGTEVGMYIFVYEETNLKSLITDGRKIIVPEATNKDLSEIEVEYVNGPNKKNYLLKEIKNLERQHKIVLLYRSYLTKILRYLDTYLKKKASAEELQIDKIIDLGGDN